MARIVVKKGEFRKDEDRLLLINEDMEIFQAEEATIFIWNMCDGRTKLEDMVEAFKNRFMLGKRTTIDFKGIIRQKIVDLKNMGLVDIIDTKEKESEILK